MLTLLKYYYHRLTVFGKTKRNVLHVQNLVNSKTFCQGVLNIYDEISKGGSYTFLIAFGQMNTQNASTFSDQSNEMGVMK